MDCVNKTGLSICHHLRKYYLSVDEPPHVFWIYDFQGKVQDGIEFIQETSTSGDVCHYNMKGLSNGKAKRIFTEEFDQYRDGQICVENQDHRKFCQDDVEFYLKQVTTLDELS